MIKVEELQELRLCLPDELQQSIQGDSNAEERVEYNNWLAENRLVAELKLVLELSVES